MADEMINSAWYWEQAIYEAGQDHSKGVGSTVENACLSEGRPKAIESAGRARLRSRTAR
jgi:hypothetical protein